MPGPDPLAQPEPLIRSVYAYAAYRVGRGPDAEDVTSATFERAIKYRSSYDREKGEPLAWLIGIARRVIAEAAEQQTTSAGQARDLAAPGSLEENTARRLDLAASVMRLDERDRELIALRYGADLSARQIGVLLGERTNTIEVALHRALNRLRAILERERTPAEEIQAALRTVRI